MITPIRLSPLLTALGLAACDNPVLAGPTEPEFQRVISVLMGTPKTFYVNGYADSCASANGQILKTSCVTNGYTVILECEAHGETTFTLKYRTFSGAPITEVVPVQSDEQGAGG